MRDVEITDYDADDNEEIKHLQNTVEQRTKATFDMLGNEDDRAELFLEVTWKFANVIYNRFGNEYKFQDVEVREENGKKKQIKGYIRIPVHLSPTFYRWVAGFGGGVKIAKPKGDAWAKQGDWSDKKKYRVEMSKAELDADYERAIAGYKEFLEEEAGWVE